MLNDTITIGKITLQPSSNTLLNNGERNRIEPRLMALMLRLHAANGEVVSRDELLDDVWRDQPGSDEALTQAISRLRRVIGDASKGSIIETIPKRGYRLLHPTTLDAQAQHSMQAAQQLSSVDRFKFNQNALLWAAIALLLGLYLHSSFTTQTEQHEIEIILKE